MAIDDILVSTFGGDEKADGMVTKRKNTDKIDVLLWSTVYCKAAINLYKQNDFREIFRMRNIIMPWIPFDLIAMRRTFKRSDYNISGSL